MVNKPLISKALFLRGVALGGAARITMIICTLLYACWAFYFSYLLPKGPTVHTWIQSVPSWWSTSPVKLAFVVKKNAFVFCNN